MSTGSTLVDRVKIEVISSGTGPFALGGALPAFRGVEALLDGAQYSYAVESGSNYECGVGVFDGPNALFQRNPTLSSNGGAPVSFPSGVQLIFTALAADYAGGPGGGSFSLVNALGFNPDVAIAQDIVTRELNLRALASEVALSIAALEGLIAAKQDLALPVIPVVGSQTFGALATDPFKYYLLDTEDVATTVTIAEDATVVVPVGARIYIETVGTGDVTIEAAAGVTLLSRASAYMVAGESGVIVITKRGVDVWTLTGDLA